MGQNLFRKHDERGVAQRGNHQIIHGHGFLHLLNIINDLFWRATNGDLIHVTFDRIFVIPNGLIQRFNLLGFLCACFYTTDTAFLPELISRFDAIVCNPPYVRTADLAGLDEEVRDFEPHLALDGGEDGLAFYRRIAAPASLLLEADGGLFLEVGGGQADSVSGLLEQSGIYEGIEVLADLASVPRVVCGRRRTGLE